MRVKFTQAARKHKIGRAHVLAALANAGEPEVVPAEGDRKQARLKWVAPDDRGLDLEIMAVQMPDYLLIIHVMPAGFRERRQS